MSYAMPGWNSERVYLRVGASDVNAGGAQRYVCFMIIAIMIYARTISPAYCRQDMRVATWRQLRAERGAPLSDVHEVLCQYALWRRGEVFG